MMVEYRDIHLPMKRRPKNVTIWYRPKKNLVSLNDVNLNTSNQSHRWHQSQIQSKNIFKWNTPSNPTRQQNTIHLQKQSKAMLLKTFKPPNSIHNNTPSHLIYVITDIHLQHKEYDTNKRTWVLWQLWTVNWSDRVVHLLPVNTKFASVSCQNKKQPRNF